MAALSDVIAAVRARIAAEVSSLTLSLSIETITEMPSHKLDKVFSVYPSRTTNTRSGRPTDGIESMRDRLVVEIAARLQSGDQVTNFDAALDTAESVRVALTNDTWWRATADVQCVEFIDETRTRRGGFVLFAQNYDVTRQGALG